MEQGGERITTRSTAGASPRVRRWFLVALTFLPACAAPPQYRPRLIRPAHHRLLPKHGASYADLAAAVEQPGGASPERLLELAKRAAKSAGHNPDEAIAAYRDSAAYAVFALSLAGPDQPKLRDEAVDRHNHAVEQLILASGAGEEKRIDPAWKSRLESSLIEIAPSGPTLPIVPNDAVWIARNSRTSHLERVQQAGLGVPLVSVSHYPDRQAEPDRFLPKDLELPATAVIEPQGPLEGGAWRLQPVRLNLIDPKGETHLTIPGSPCRIPLAYDLTTPLAHQFLARPMLQFSWVGLLDPDRANLPSGIFLQTPYQPGKIPVLFIHGLFSNPEAWLRMANVLQADPVLRERYQFWFAFYPTGAPFATSALRIRKELAAVRDAIDPGHADPALDRMVVVGHSLGGVISRQMLQSSGDALEKGLFTIPFEQVKMSDETRRLLTELMYFEPVPSIGRVVFLAAPHRGSGVANQFIGRFTDALVRPPTRLLELHREVIALNGRKVLTPAFRRRPPSSVDNLKPDSPILTALANLPMAPGIPYHSIIATLTPEGPQSLWSDGVVPYWSAHLDGAQSEHIIRYSHFANEPLSAAEEVHRILRLHLDENAQ